MDTPDLLPEQKTEIKVMYTKEVAKESIFSLIFQCISRFSKLINVVKLVLKFIRKIDKVRQNRGTSLALAAWR